MVSALLNRIGNLGLLLTAGALLVGGLAGAAVVSHYDRLPAAPAHSQENREDDGQAQSGQKSQPTKQKRSHEQNQD